jgi:hypothetical protein
MRAKAFLKRAAIGGSLGMLAGVLALFVAFMQAISTPGGKSWAPDYPGATVAPATSGSNPAGGSYLAGYGGSTDPTGYVSVEPWSLLEAVAARRLKMGRTEDAIATLKSMPSARRDEFLLLLLRAPIGRVAVEVHYARSIAGEGPGSQTSEAPKVPPPPSPEELKQELARGVAEAEKLAGAIVGHVSRARAWLEISDRQANLLNDPAGAERSLAKVVSEADAMPPPSEADPGSSPSRAPPRVRADAQTTSPADAWRSIGGGFALLWPIVLGFFGILLVEVGRGAVKPIGEAVAAWLGLDVLKERARRTPASAAARTVVEPIAAAVPGGNGDTRQFEPAEDRGIGG